MRRALLLLASLEVCDVAGHVAMRYVDGVSPGPIRNAGSATGNGRGSVAGACGGRNLAFGANGVGQIQDGQEVTLNINYAAGHASNQNYFRMAYACGDGSQGSVSGEDVALDATANGCTATAAGAAAPYVAKQGVAAPQAIVPGGYSVTCTLPTKNVQASTDCTLSLLDQRDWGGCIDVNVLPANAALPPAPPPAPIVSNAGSYPFSRATMVDSSASTFNCCPIESGSLTVPDYTPLTVASFTATVSARATNCRTSSAITAPETATHNLDLPLTFTYKLGSKFTATAQWAGQPFDVTVENGRLDFANSGAEQPIVCDGYSANSGGGGGGGGGGGSAGGGASGTGAGESGGVSPGVVAVLVILILLAVAGGTFFYCRGKKSGGPSSGQKYGGAPPPPPPPSHLPAGWTEMSDPSSGNKYYYNSVTGETTWSNPASHV